MADKIQKIREKVEKKLEVMQYQIHRKDAYKELKCVLDYIDSMQEDPVSEGLEEAATLYAKEEYSRKNPATLPDRCIGCYAPIMYTFKAGAKWQKEQMMVNAVDGIARPNDNEIWCILDSFNLKDGDKVRVIVIKED